MAAKNLFKEVFRYKETDCTIIADNEKAVKAAVSSIKFHRKELEEYGRHNPRFLYSLTPVKVDEGPLVAKLMAEATKKADVGPMAAVAGVLADLAVENMILTGSDVAIVEDGGEISAVSNKPVDVALLAGDSLFSGTFGFRVKDFPTGISTTSGRFSHALSFGDADAVTVFSKTAGMADAATTAIGNLVKGKNHRQAIRRGIKRALSIEGVEGVLIIYRGTVGMAGRIPEIIKLNIETNTTPYLEALKSHLNPISPQTHKTSIRDSCISNMEFI